MPKQFLKGLDRSGLGLGVFYPLRRLADGSLDPDFILNLSPWRDAAFLVVGPNFGCGSSREHAVWGLMELGIRAVLGTSFAGIFYDNCARNGLLALDLPPELITKLVEFAADSTRNLLTIDLPAQTIQLADRSLVHFEVTETLKEMLTSGLDLVAATLKSRNEIARFEEQYHRTYPWLRP